jgi:hypothetical protein
MLKVEFDLNFMEKLIRFLASQEPLFSISNFVTIRNMCNPSPLGSGKD